MGLYINIVIGIIVVLIVLHYKKYRDYSGEYIIDQQELDNVRGAELYNQLNPLVITYIEDISFEENVKDYKLYSPLSFFKKFTELDEKYIVGDDSNKYYRHSREILLLRPEKECVISLINPKYSKKLKYVGKKDRLIGEYELEKPEEGKEVVNSVDVIVRDYNILYIPRHWYFQMKSSDKKIDVFYSDNLFTKMYNRFI